MKSKYKKYNLVENLFVHKEGISIYKVIRDGESSDELVLKYFHDVKKLLDEKLQNLINDYKVPKKEVERIQVLIKELIYVSELKDKCEDISN
jgi:hypothetical protein